MSERAYRGVWGVECAAAVCGVWGLETGGGCGYETGTTGRVWRCGLGEVEEGEKQKGLGVAWRFSRATNSSTPYPDPRTSSTWKGTRNAALCDECHAYNYKYHLETRNNTPPIAYLSPSAFKGAIAPARAAAPPLMLEHEAAPSEAKESVRS